MLAINSADDERNPPETGIEGEAMKRVKNGKLYLVPASEETRRKRGCRIRIKTDFRASIARSAVTELNGPRIVASSTAI